MEFILLVLLISSVYSTQIIASVTNKHQPSDLNTYRLLVVQNNLALINKHNSDQSKTYSLKPNPMFIGYTQEQITARFLTPIFSNEVQKKSTMPKVTIDPKVSVKASNSILFDLRTYASTPVKNGGRECKNSYSYVTADMMDMLGLVRKLGRPLLSSQQITDCSSDKNIPLYYRNQGCYNGLLNNSLYYVQNNGVVSEKTYPVFSGALEKGQNQTCVNIYQNGDYSKRYTISSWRELQRNNPNDRATALMNRKPVGTYIAAGSMNFIFYQNGIFNNCTDTTLSHAVVLVGFSFNNPYGNYWIIKNSWGKNWGEGGYARISMDSKCGLLQYGYVPAI